MGNNIDILNIDNLIGLKVLFDLYSTFQFNKYDAFYFFIINSITVA